MYEIFDLGLLPGTDSAEAAAVNSYNAVAGTCFTQTPAKTLRRAFFWNKGALIDLGTLGGEESAAYGINDANEIVGWAHDRNGLSKAFIWTQNGGMLDLGLNPAGHSIAIAINKVGAICGAVDYWSAFVRDPSANVQMLTPGNVGAAMALNKVGSVAGWIGDPDYPNGFYWDVVTGQMTISQERLVFGGGEVPQMGLAKSNLIACNRDYQSYAARWNPGAPMVPLPTSFSNDQTWAGGINDKNFVVGTSFNANGRRAVLWQPWVGSAIDLNSLASPSALALRDAHAISDFGSIVGAAIVGTNAQQKRAFLAVPHTKVMHLFPPVYEWPIHVVTNPADGVVIGTTIDGRIIRVPFGDPILEVIADANRYLQTLNDPDKRFEAKAALAKTIEAALEKLKRG